MAALAVPLLSHHSTTTVVKITHSRFMSPTLEKLE
jgi:hypothetical protein